MRFVDLSVVSLCLDCRAAVGAHPTTLLSNCRLRRLLVILVALPGIKYTSRNVKSDPLGDLCVVDGESENICLFSISICRQVGYA